MEEPASKYYREAKNDLISACANGNIPALQQVETIRMLGGKLADNDPDLAWLKIDIKTKHYTKKMSAKKAKKLFAETHWGDLAETTQYSTTSLKLYRSYLDLCNQADARNRSKKIVCAVVASFLFILLAMGVWYGDYSGLFYGSGYITFKANGEVLSQNVLRYNSNAVVTIPERSGYDVVGIVDNNSGELMFDNNGVAYSKTSTRDLSDYSECDLEVVYTPHVYNAAVKNSGGATLCTFTYTVEDLPEDVIDAPQKLEGYTFDGWFTDSKYKKPFSGKFSDYVDSSLVLYPHYSLSGWSITWNLNGGELSVDFIDSYTILTDLTLPDGDMVKKQGYELDGWMLNGKKIDYFVPTVMCDVTLTAIWTPVNYSITYILNDGGLENALETYTIEDEVILDTPVRSGYKFCGWFGNQAFNGEKTEKIERGTIGDKVLYAKWTPIVYTVQYNLEGGENSPLNPEFYTAEKLVSLRDPTRTGYDFIGWFVQGEEDKITSLNAAVDGDITLTAQWQAKEYAITAYLNNGTEPINIKAIYDAGYSLPVPSRCGYTFINYTLNGNIFDIYGIFNYSSDITVFANYEPNIYKITYVSEGNAIGEQTVYYSSPFVLAASPTRPNYEFVGWYDDVYGGNKVTDGTYNWLSNITVHAKWLKTQTINLESNNEYSIDSTVEKVYVIGNYTGANEIMTQININVLRRDNNLTLNLINVGFKAKENKTAIDCANSSYTLTVIISGKVYIEGGDGSCGLDGVSGSKMNASNCHGANGLDGKNALNVGTVVFESDGSSAELTLKGGSGGAGGNGGVDTDRSRMWLNYTPNGGNGGASNSALNCVAYSVNGVAVNFVKGSVGAAGKAGSRGTWWCSACYGNDGLKGNQVDSITYK